MKKILLATFFLLASIGFAKADSNPSFPGGEQELKKYISEHTKYPQSAKDNGVEGIVTVQFMVQTDGSLNSLAIERMVDPDLEDEALRVVKGMPAWIPAEKDGSPIEAPAKVEVPFIIE